MHSEAPTTGRVEAELPPSSFGVPPSPASTNRWLTAVAAALVAAAVVAVFWKTVFLGQPISRLYLLSHWDSLFSGMAIGPNFRIDPTGLLQSVPYYTLAAQQFHAGVWPLWNHLNAFGTPFCGDLQPSILSPLRLLFDLQPCAYTYNLQLVTEVLVCALGTFALCRELKCGRVAAMMAALSFALCPFMLWYVELQSGVGFVFYPAVLWLFARAANSNRAMDAVVAGILSGLTLLIGHPEPAFFGTAYGALLMALIAVPQNGWRSFLINLSIAAAASLSVAAPALLPFVEYLRNSDCYKFGMTKSVSITWKAFATNLLTPLAAGASPYLGTILVSFAPLSLLRTRDRHSDYALAMATVFVVALVPSLDLWPYSLLSRHVPFSYLITTYIVPIALLSLSVLSALGLTAYQTRCVKQRWLLPAAVALIAVTASLPFLLSAAHFHFASTAFDLTLPPPHFDKHACVRGAVCSGIFAAGAVLLFALKRSWCTVALSCLALVLNSIMVGGVVKQSLPVTPSFTLPATAATDYLKQSQARCLAMGEHLLKPNLNILYGIDDVCSMNVMWPSRYLRYITACGADIDQYTQRFNGRVSKLIDLASVKYVISQSPVICAEDPQPQGQPLNQLVLPAPLPGGITLAGGQVWSDLAAGAAGAVLRFDLPQNKRLYAGKKLIAALVDSKEQVVWFSDLLPIKKQVAFAAPLPDVNAQTVKIALRIYDAQAVRFEQFAQSKTDLLRLAQMKPVTQKQPPHFLPLKKFSPGNILLYENSGALPRAYVAHSVINAGGEKEAFEQVTAAAFDPHRQVVIESAGASPQPPQPIAEAIVRQREANRTVVEYESSKDGWLVLTDTVYPGWTATVDGKPVAIKRANYLFRAVPAPAGKHVVQFAFIPLTFWLGIGWSALFWSLFISLCLFTVLRRGNRA